MKYEIQQQSFEKGYGGFWYDRTGDYFIDDSDTLEEALSIAKWYAQRVADGLMNSNVYVWKLNENGEEEQLMYKYEPFTKSYALNASDEAYSCHRDSLSVEDKE